jgi:hypothetical protein
MRRGLALASLLSLVAFASLDAQTVRGVVVDESTKLPIASVVVTLVDVGGRDILPGTRSDSLGRFTIHASSPGRYRVRAVRIGYQPLTSESISLGISQLAELRLQMSTVPERLVPVRVLERRRLNARELMSSTGFDLRRSKGVGTFMDAEQLGGFGEESASDLLNTRLRHLVYVADTTEGTILLMRRPTSPCTPEIWVDGVGLTAGNPMDSQTGRNAMALSALGGYPASELHGLEVYRAAQIPPASLGGFLGAERSGVLSSERCGVVAVWTKAGAARAATAARRGDRATGVQVLIGRVVDFDSGKPVAGVPVRLLSEQRYPLEDPVRSDTLGEFVIRTKRSGRFRLEAGSIGFNPASTAPFAVAAEELVILTFFVSATRPVNVPLGISVRALPETYAVTSLGGFSYRQAHGVVGTFFDRAAIERRQVTTFGELVRGTDGVFVSGTPPADTIAMRSGLPGPEMRCFPAWFVDGVRVRTSVDSAVRALPLAAVIGVEIYRSPAEVPTVFADATDGDCGLVGIWTNGA